MDIVKTGEYLIHLLKSVLGSALPDKPPEDVNPNDLIKIATSHSVLNLLGYAAERMPDINGQLFKYLEQAKNMAVMKEARQEIETQAVLDAFEKRGIGCMPLKGYITKRLYPSVDMRTMCDCDILVKPENLSEAEKIMRELEFNEREEGGHDISFRKPPNISIEIHKCLVTEKGWPAAAKYYSDIWDRVKLSDGKNYSYEMTDEDFYIFMQVHTAKHYRSGGCGIRSVMDTYIYNRHLGNSLDREYIECEFKKLGILEFVKKFEELSLIWFADREPTELSRKMTEYILGGGTYGSKENNDAVNAMKDVGTGASAGSATFMRYVRVIFVPYRGMIILYPILKKIPVLLPFLWIYRIIHRFFFKRDKVKTVMDINVKKETMDYLTQHFEEVGL